jgi:hypothetical protein
MYPMKNKEMEKVGVMQFYGFILLDYLMQIGGWDLNDLTFDGHGMSEIQLELGLDYLDACGYKWGDQHVAL